MVAFMVGCWTWVALGAILKIREEKMGPGWDPPQNMIYGPEKCVESIAMMVYYCQGTGCSLISQYSRQESILNSQNFRDRKNGEHQHCSTVYYVLPNRN